MLVDFLLPHIAKNSGIEPGTPERGQRGASAPLVIHLRKQGKLKYHF